MAYQPTVKINPDNLDAAARLRVSQSFGLLDIKQVNNNQPLYYDEQLIGGATAVYNQSEGGVAMGVSGPGEKAIRQSFKWSHYNAGKSKVAELTVSDFHPQSGATKRIGIFSSSTSSDFSANLDGIFIESGNSISVNIYKDGTQVHRAERQDWNLDKLDGTGPSGLDLDNADFARFQIWLIDFLYLGGSSVRFGIIAKGKLTYVHQFNHAFVNDTLQGPLMLYPQQPIRYEIFTSPLDFGTASLNQICAQVSSEGDLNTLTGVPVGISTDAPVTGISDGDEVAILAFRLKPSFRNITALLKSISIATTTNDDGILRIRLNPGVDNEPSFASVNADSALEYYTGQDDCIISGGFPLWAKSVKGNGSSRDDLGNSIQPGSAIDGTMDRIVLTWEPVSAGAGCIASVIVTQLL